MRFPDRHLIGNAGGFLSLLALSFTPIALFTLFPNFFLAIAVALVGISALAMVVWLGLVTVGTIVPRWRPSVAAVLVAVLPLMTWPTLFASPILLLRHLGIAWFLVVFVLVGRGWVGVPLTVATLVVCAQAGEWGWVVPMGLALANGYFGAKQAAKWLLAIAPTASQSEAGSD